MPWRRAFIRKEMLIYGEVHPSYIIPEQVRFRHTDTSNNPTPTPSPSDPINPFTPLPLRPPTASSIADALIPVHTELPSRLYTHTLPLPQSTPPPGVSNFLHHLRHHIAASQIPVLHLGEPIDAFLYRQLIELPAPLMGMDFIEMRYFIPPETPGEPTLSAMLLAYGRRIFIAVKPLNNGDSLRGRLVLSPERILHFPLPNPFTHPIRGDIVQHHRVGGNFLDPSVFVGVSSGVLGQPLVDAVEPSWNGFLVIEREGESALLVRASAVRLKFARQPQIRDIQCLPRTFELRREHQIPVTECLEEVSVPYAEWLGVFLTKDEAGITADDEQLNKVHEELLTKRMGYRINVRRGMLYMWGMNIGDLYEGQFNFVFAVVPDTGRINIQNLTLRARGRASWSGTMSIFGISLKVKCVRWAVPNRRAMVDFGWGNQLLFETSIDVRRVLPLLVRQGKWACRFLPDEDDFVVGLQIMTVGFTMMEMGSAYTCRIRIQGDEGRLQDLVIFADNVEGVGMCLMGVSISFEELGLGL